MAGTREEIVELKEEIRELHNAVISLNKVTEEYLDREFQKLRDELKNLKYNDKRLEELYINAFNSR